MLDEVRRPPESLAALTTRIRPLTTVDACMLQQARALAEGLATLATLIGLLTSVDPPVLGEL